MLKKEYPLHDMNVVFDIIADSLSHGDCHDIAIDEMHFLNRLFAALPAEAVEYGMRFLHGEKNLPPKAQEISTLYIRFVNLVEYCEKIDYLRDIPSNLTTEAIMERQEIMTSLDEHEKAFGKPLLGFQMNSSMPEDGIYPSEVPAELEGTEEQTSDSSSLHLMNASASVFACKNPFSTAIFYETKLGFIASHLSDETMPHIRLTRDNINIVLVEGTGDVIKPLHELCDIKYDLYIYASEPLLLQQELKNNGVHIIEELIDAATCSGSMYNRQFIFEDNDGRRICVSQRLEEIM